METWNHTGIRYIKCIMMYCKRDKSPIITLSLILQQCSNEITKIDSSCWFPVQSLLQVTFLVAVFLLSCNKAPDANRSITNFVCLGTFASFACCTWRVNKICILMSSMIIVWPVSVWVTSGTLLLPLRGWQLCFFYHGQDPQRFLSGKV